MPNIMEDQGEKKYAHEDYTPKIILARLNEFRKEGKFCDVKILVGASEFPAHKVILAAFSPCLEELFSKGYSGTCHFILELNCVEASLVEILLEYVYTTEVEFSESNVSGLLHLAKFFKAAPLFESCCRYMEKNVNAQNCLAYYKLANAYSRESLREKSESCIWKNFEAVRQGNDFLELPSDSMTEIIGCDSLKVGYEEAIVEAVVRWLHFKEEERTNELPKILSTVQLELLDPDYLLGLVAKEPALRRLNCMPLIQEAADLSSAPSRRTAGSLQTRRAGNDVTNSDSNVHSTTDKMCSTSLIS